MRDLSPDAKQTAATIFYPGVVGTFAYVVGAWNNSTEHINYNSAIASDEISNYYLGESEHAIHQTAGIKKIDENGIRINNQQIISYRNKENAIAFPDTMPAAIAGFSFIAIAAALIASGYSFFKGRDSRAFKRQARQELKEDADIIKEFLEFHASFSGDTNKG